MKKDIFIPRVEDVYIAIVQEHNPLLKSNDWNAYIINTKSVAIEMVLIVSKGFDNEIVTATMRHKIERLPESSYAKIEFMQDAVLALNNEFKVSFFENNILFDKSYLFKKNTINKQTLGDIPIMDLKGVLAI